jgi:transcriptional regulator with XRE-family HTH domain
MSGHRKFSELLAPIEADPVRRERVAQNLQAMRDVLRLTELRRARGATQTEVAQALEVSQANVSRLEHEEDVYLSTLRSYVGALGGHLEVNAVFPDGTFEIERGRALPQRRGTRRRLAERDGIGGIE